MKIIEADKSSIGNYDIVVTETTDVNEFGQIKQYMSMLEVAEDQMVSEVTHVFTQTYSHESLRYSSPLGFAATAIDILSEVITDDSPVLIAGLGGGAVHSGLELRLTERGIYPNILSVECDKTVIKFAYKYWGFTGQVIEDTIEHALTDVFESDSIKYLFLNVYSAANGVTPQDMCTNVDWVDLCLDRLMDGGTLVINCFGQDHEAKVEAIKGYAEFIRRPCEVKAHGSNTFVIISNSPWY